jgi:hypothetical protein
VLRDDNYVSARFYVDTYKFARVFLEVLAERAPRP